eukprot:scaffold4123_cov29-Attheya_sp.AAC.1
MEARLAGYGARFYTDRSNHLFTLHLYDTSFERVLDYSGYFRRDDEHQTTTTSPQTQMMKLRASTNRISETKKGAKSFFQNMFGGGSSNKDATTDIDAGGTTKVVKEEQPTVEDVLTWMPPACELLADTTMVLLQITLSGGLSRDNHRWKHLRTSWETLLEEQGDESLTFSIPIQLASSLLVKPPSSSSTITATHPPNNSAAAVDQFSKSVYTMGTLLNLGGEETEEIQLPAS